MFIIYNPLNQREARKQFRNLRQWFLDNPRRRVCNTELGKIRRAHIEEDLLEFCRDGVTITSAKKKPKLQTDKLRRARYHASYFGAECQANPGTSLEHYKDSISRYYGYKSWSKMPADLVADAIEHFKAGRAKEKKHQR